MKVLIGEHIGFEENCDGDSFAMIFGDYRIEEMTEKQFQEWSDQTNEDWITEEYQGDIFISKRASAADLFYLDLKLKVSA